MTAVTLSPHQLANLQQQRRELPTTDNSCRPHGSRTNSHQFPGCGTDTAIAMRNPTAPRESRQYEPSGKLSRRVSYEAVHEGEERTAPTELDHTKKQQQENAVAALVIYDQGGQRPNPMDRLRSTHPTNNSQAAALASRLIAAHRQTSHAKITPQTGSGSGGKSPRPLVRAKSDLGPQRAGANAEDGPAEEENWELRHGWEDQYNSDEYLSTLTSVSIRRTGIV